MITYELFFKKYCVRRLSEIYSPLPKVDSEIEFPKGSTYYTYHFETDVRMIEKNSFLTLNDDILVKTIGNYSLDTVGIFRHLPTEVKKYIMTSAKNEPKINFIKNNTAIMRSNTLLVKSFLGLSTVYKYSSNPLLPYWRFINTFNTMIAEANKELERNIFIPFNINTSLHYTKFVEYLNKKMTSGLINLLPSSDIFLMFELWKMIFKSKREESLFSKINPDKLKKVHLMFTTGNKAVIINLAMLLNICDSMEEITTESGFDFDIDLHIMESKDGEIVISDLTTENAVIPRLTKLPEKTFGKLLYIMFNKLNTNIGLENVEVTNNIVGTTTTTTTLDVIKNDVVVEPVTVVGKVIDKPKVEATKTNTKTNTKVDSQPKLKEVETVKVIPEAAKVKILKTDHATEKTLDDILDMFGDDDTLLLDEVSDDLIIPEEEDVDDGSEIINNSDIRSINLNGGKSITKDINKKPIVGESIKGKIDILYENKLISKNRYEKMATLLKEQDNIVIKINGKNTTLKEIVNDAPKFNLDKDKINIKSNVVVKDKESLKNTTLEVMKDFIENDHEKMVIKTIMGIQNSDFIVTDIKIKEDESILGGMVNYNVELLSLDGSKNVLPMVIPKVYPDGTYRLSKNSYIMRKQRNDLPIRKISHNEVMLNSDYGKLSITRGVNKATDVGYWLRNQLFKLYDNNVIGNLVTREKAPNLAEINLPSDYTLYSRYIKMFNFQDFIFSFNYNTRETLVDDIAKYETDGVVIGKKENGNVLIMRYDNVVYEFKQDKFKELGTMDEILSLDIDNKPFEITTIKLFKTRVPLIFMLGYYYGIEQLLAHYNIKFYYEQLNTRVDSNKYLVIKLAEDKLVMERNTITDMLFSGLLALKDNSKLLRRLNDKNDYDIIFNLMNYSLLVRNEFKNLDDLFISPLTLELLQKMKMPLTFRGLLFKSLELLQDDNYQNPKAITGMNFKGYERFSSMLYKEYVNGIREQRNKSEFSKAKISINPYSVIKKLNEDSTTILVNDINPIANLKQYEDVTYLGAGGRNKESLSEKTRGYDDDDIGILSEANKDSGDVGITSFLSASPNITNTLGMVEKLAINNETSWANILSTSAMIAPFATNDDTKRLVFSGIQNEHVVPMINMDIPYIRTGYETLIGNRIGGKYCIVAEGKGLVKHVDSKSITVKYDNGKTKTYKLYSWYSKIESNSCYKHTLVSNVKKDIGVDKDDVLGYIDTFFRPDPYDNRRVVYLQHKIAKLAFIEDITTYEDSTGLSNEFSKQMHIKNIKLNSKVMDAKDNVIDMISIGNKVTPETTIFTTSNQTLDITDLSEEEIEYMKEANGSSKKSKYNGVIDNIEIFYNCEIEEMSESLRALVIESDKKLLEVTGFTGKVNGSYSISGAPLQVGSVEVRIFVSIDDDMSIADKMIYGNQLKCTVGEVFSKIRTAKTNEPVDATFSTISFEKRITPSLLKMGVLSTGMKKIESNAIDLYFK